MTEQNEHTNQYSAADIERYYSGKMPAQEMHQLEKAALEDPFLADALEGYRYAAKPQEDSEELKKALLSKLEMGKVVPLQKRRDERQLLKIAAMFVLIAGTAWLVYQFGFGNPQKDIAATTETTKEKTVADTPASLAAPSNADLSATADSVTTESASALAGNSNRKKLNSTTASQKQADKDGSDKEETLVTSSLNKNAGRAAAEGMKQENDQVADVGTYTQEAAPQAAMRSRKEDTAVVIGYGTQRKVDANAGNVIVLQKAKDSNMQEIVLGKSRNDSSARRRSNITFEDVEPEKGQRFYDDYVTRNLNIPEEIKMKNTSGEVQLSFDVNELGEPVNIKVEKSLCEDCDKEAVRILKEGPKWDKRKSKKGKIKIRF